MGAIYTVALDIGTTKICGAVGKLKRQDNTLEVISFAEEKCDGVKFGQIDNVENTSNAIYEVLLKLAQESFVTIGEVYVGVSGRHVTSWRKQHTMVFQEKEKESEHIITKNDIELLKESLKNKIIPDIRNNIIIGLYQHHFKIDHNPPVSNPIGRSGTRLEGHFMVITTSESTVNKIKMCIDRAASKIDSSLHYIAKEKIHVKYMFQGIASGRSVLNEDEIDEGTCVIDIGGGTTDYVIFEKKTVQSVGVFAVGGERLTEDIKEGCRIKFSDAEKIKIEAGFAYPTESLEQEQMVAVANSSREEKPREIPKKYLTEIIHARLSEIIEWIHTQMISAGYHKKITQHGIVLTGGGSNQDGIKSLVELKTGIPVRIGWPTEHINSLKIRSIADAKYATLVGLLIEGMNDAKNDIIHHRNTITVKETEPSATTTSHKKGGILDALSENAKQFTKNAIEKTKEFLLDDIK